MCEQTSAESTHKSLSPVGHVVKKQIIAQMTRYIRNARGAKRLYNLD